MPLPTIKELTFSLGRWCDLDANYLGIGPLWIGDFALSLDWVDFSFNHFCDPHKILKIKFNTLVVKEKKVIIRNYSKKKKKTKKKEKKEK